jgi:signal transduction histidine kinase
MRRPRVRISVALTVCVLALPLLAAAASAAGYLVEAHRQQADRSHRLAVAAAYVRAGTSQASDTRWQQALTGQLAALDLTAQLTIATPTSKRSVYQPHARAGSSKTPLNAGTPTASYVLPLPAPGQILRIDLFARPLDRNRRLLVALACGLAALLAGAGLLLWAARRALVAPLRRLSTQVDAVAGGAPIGARTTSPIVEVDTVAGAVAGMAASLAQTAEQEARLDAERQLLVSSIAHDLRTPLFSLRGYLDAIAAGIGDPEVRLDQARAKAELIDRLVTGLFDYTRAQVDARPQLQRADLADAVTGAATGFELAAGEHEVELRVDARAGTTVRIDPDAFERALGNVIDNALRHTPRGGAIDVTTGEEAGSAYIRVVDDGPGIAPELLPRVFEPNAGSRSGGAGLGLTIAARLLRDQGGTIQAANAPGRGAILTLRLPAAGSA